MSTGAAPRRSDTHSNQRAPESSLCEVLGVAEPGFHEREYRSTWSPLSLPRQHNGSCGSLENSGCLACRQTLTTRIWSTVPRRATGYRRRIAARVTTDPTIDVAAVRIGNQSFRSVGSL